MLGSKALRSALLRISLLLLLTAGMSMHLVLIHLSELHAAEHAVLAGAASAHHAHGYQDSHGTHAHFAQEQHGHDNHLDDDPGDDRGDHKKSGKAPDHMKGLHGLMHFTDFGSSTGMLFSWKSPEAQRSGSFLVMHDPGSGPQQNPSSLFRPPIV